MRQFSLLLVLAGASAAYQWAAPAPQDSKAARAKMVQEIQSRFVLAKIQGGDLRQAGTVLVVQKDGIGAVPGSGVGVLSATFGTNYKDGRIRRDFLSAMVANQAAGLRNLDIGEGVYLLRVQVTDSNVVLDVQTCGACNPAAPEPNPMRATVTFPFKKGFLENTSVQQILNTIGDVFTLPNVGPATEPPPPGPPVAEGQPPAAQPPAPPSQPGQEPLRIGLGQTMDQVRNILGQPEKVFDLGAKKIYLYKDLKITFVDGVVSDVQ